MPIAGTGYKDKMYVWHKDINASFVLAREANHRVLSSSVMVHACDAMDAMIDVIYYGRSDRKVWLLDLSKVKSIIEKEN